MSHALVIARRELAEKRFVFFAAVAFALLAMVVPLVPGLESLRRDGVAVTSMILAAGFTLGLAAILGASMVGRDAAAGRLSFYFARPVGAASIWFGKLAAALVLLLASFAIVLLPGLIASGGQLGRAVTLNFSTVAGALAVAAIVFFFVAHAVSTMIRSRSVLIGFDFAAALLTGFLVWQMVRPLIGTTVALGVLLAIFAGAAVIAFIVAGAWQLADGRIDRRRSHAAFSKALWAGMAVALLLSAAYVSWMLAVTPRDFASILNVEPSSSGKWLVIRGVTRHRFDYQPAFLLDEVSGASRRIPDADNAIFSPDGSKLLQVRQEYKAPEIVVIDTATGRTTETGIRMKAMRAYPIVVNDDLSRFAAYDFENSTMTVYDTVARRSLGSAHLTFFPSRFFFVSPGVVRLHSITSQRIATYEFDAEHQSLRQTSSADWRPATLRVTADGTRAVTQEYHSPSLTVRDARTMQPLQTLPLPSDKSRFFLLHDGRIVIADGQTLRLAGSPAAVDVGARTFFAVDIGGGKVAVVLATPKPGIAVVDLDRGTLIRREPSMSVVVAAMTQFDPRPLQWTQNLITARRNGEVLRWNAVTGETKVLVPR